MNNGGKKMKEHILAVHNEIEFDEPTHTYTFEGQELISGTTFISQFHKPFNKHVILSRYPPEQRIRMKYKWDNSSTWGTMIHELLELELNGIQTNREVQVSKGLNLISDFLEQDYELVGCEIRITNGTIGGMIDVLMQHKITKKFLLLDYKTSEKLPKHAYQDERFYEPFQDIEYCKFNKYSMQLSLYSAILEDNYDIEVDDMFILWIPLEGKECAWRCEDYRNVIRRVL